MSTVGPNSRSSRIRRGTRADGIAVLTVFFAVAIAFTVVRFMALVERDAPENDGWAEVLEADSAYRAGASPRRVPEGLTGLDSVVWVVYELRDERRRAAGNLFSDSALAHTVCGTGCRPSEVDSTQAAGYRGRVVRDLLTRAELEADRAARGLSISASLFRAWNQAKKMGFELSDLLLVIAGGVIIALVLKYAPMEEASRRR